LGRHEKAEQAAPLVRIGIGLGRTGWFLLAQEICSIFAHTRVGRHET
jgi:hypothetical protein